MRTVPTGLNTHLSGDGTTCCFLLKVTASDGTVIAVTTLDQDVDYDDGGGTVTYSAAIGMNQSSLDTTSNLEVDNSEALMLFADTGDFTEQKIEAGLLDYADFVIYRVNWADLSQGHYIVQTGTTGKVKKSDGQAATVELRGLPQRLKQNYNEVYSLTCRARFGSQGGGTCVTFGACGFDAESLWQNHSVASVGDETDREFTADSVPAVNGPNGALDFVPGLVEWLTGNNAGLTSETESLVLAGTSPDASVITLRFGTPYTIQAGDTFQIRPDCAKRFQEDCIDKYDNYLNFRGEPTIPMTDARKDSMPNLINVGGVFYAPDDPP